MNILSVKCPFHIVSSILYLRTVRGIFESFELFNCLMYVRFIPRVVCSNLYAFLWAYLVQYPFLLILRDCVQNQSFSKACCASYDAYSLYDPFLDGLHNHLVHFGRTTNDIWFCIISYKFIGCSGMFYLSQWTLSSVYCSRKPCTSPELLPQYVPLYVYIGHE